MQSGLKSPHGGGTEAGCRCGMQMWDADAGKGMQMRGVGEGAGASTGPGWMMQHEGSRMQP